MVETEKCKKGNGLLPQSLIEFVFLSRHIEDRWAFHLVVPVLGVWVQGACNPAFKIFQVSIPLGKNLLDCLEGRHPNFAQFP